ncbi:MAG: hypothetical protein KBG02_02345 [Haliscomenobacter sp.]|nr:hypothetical protein [Haliscomenobacter sp.]MBK8653566.1 hypothetical protein [Haliscomenobacter sp.]MBP9075672.1 hypothetical protein [Haliscomenobacter sp.]MBP9874716.1 hypothetical protein [Haliscomenobacter sp.]
MKLLSLVVVFAFLGTLAHAQTAFSSKTGGHCFTMLAPDYMVKTYELNDVADLQYFNAEKNVYAIVIHDYKDQLKELEMEFSGPKQFLTDFTDEYQADAEDRKMTDIQEFMVGENKFAQTEMTWKTEEGYLFMLITTVETAGHFYKILTWTGMENMAAYKEDFQKMARSLKD